MILELQRGDYRISTDPDRLDLDAIHGYLQRSYWAEEIPKEIVARSLRGSLCFGLYAEQRLSEQPPAEQRLSEQPPAEQQVGFARVISDRATFAYLCDVYVLEEHRGRGLSKWLIQAVQSHPELQGLRNFLLGTRDAHGLYAQFGFTPLAAPSTYLQIRRPGLYKTQGS